MLFLSHDAQHRSSMPSSTSATSHANANPLRVQRDSYATHDDANGWAISHAAFIWFYLKKMHACVKHTDISYSLSRTQFTHWLTRALLRKHFVGSNPTCTLTYMHTHDSRELVIPARRCGPFDRTLKPSVSFLSQRQIEVAEEESNFRASQSVSGSPFAREREGEMLLIVVNAMKQLYSQMYRRNFVTGTVFGHFNDTADKVADFALIDLDLRTEVKVSKQNALTILFLFHKQKWLVDEFVLILSQIGYSIWAYLFGFSFLSCNCPQGMESISDPTKKRPKIRKCAGSNKSSIKKRPIQTHWPQYRLDRRHNWIWTWMESATYQTRWRTWAPLGPASWESSEGERSTRTCLIFHG